MNDQQIYALMAKTSKIRAVQIADALNKPLTDVSAALRSLVEVGDVVSSKGFSPNGHQCMVYDLSDQFKRSREYGALAGTAPARTAPTAVPTAAPTSAPTAAPTEAPAPAAAAPDQAGPGAHAPAAAPSADTSRLGPMMRTERALAFLLERGEQGARSLELAVAMGLREDQSPSNFLRTARERGQIKCTDGRWYSVGLASDQVDQATQSAAPAGPFRCGIWLDDEIELQRGGVTVDKLERDEALMLRDFLNRVLPAEEGV